MYTSRNQRAGIFFPGLGIIIVVAAVANALLVDGEEKIGRIGLLPSYTRRSWIGGGLVLVVTGTEMLIRHRR